MIWLLFAHHLADVAFQPSWLIKNKSEHWWSIYEHCMIWTGVISLTLLLLDRFSYWDIPILLGGHFIIDFIKYRYFKEWKWIYLDQALHYLQILIVYYAI